MITLIRRNPATDSYDYWRTEHLSPEVWLGASTDQRSAFMVANNTPMGTFNEGPFHSMWGIPRRRNLMNQNGISEDCTNFSDMEEVEGAAQATCNALLKMFSENVANFSVTGMPGPKPKPAMKRVNYNYKEKLYA